MRVRIYSAWMDYYDALEKINAIEWNSAYAINSMGTHAEAVKKELLSQLYKVLKDTRYTGFLHTGEKEFLSEKLKKIKLDTNTLHKPTYIPSIDTLIKPVYSFSVLLLNEAGVVRTIPRELTVKGDIKNAEDYKISDSIKLPEDRSVIQLKYELRQRNRIFPELLRLEAIHRLPPGILALEDDKDFEKLRDTLTTARYQKDYTLAIKELKKESYNQTLLDSVKVRLAEMKRIYPKLDTLDIILKGQDYLNWMFSFLWLTRGELLINPFFSAQNPYSSQVQKTKDSIDILNDSLSAVNKKVDFYNALIASEQPDNFDPKRHVAYESLYYHLIADKVNYERKIKKQEEALGKLKTKEEESKKKQESYIASLFQDEFVYEGLLFSSPRKKISPRLTYRQPANVMRHHDAKKDYNLMNMDYPKEISEGQRMRVLVHNENPTRDIKLNTTLVEVTDNYSFLEREIVMANKVGTEGFVEENDTLLLFVQYMNFIGFFRHGFPRLKPEKDITPSLATREAYHIINPEAPKMASYSIASRIADKDTTFQSGEYRINKLYRFRLKPGLVYSWLDDDKYTVEGNTPSLTTERHGLDIMFGVQGFLVKQDIRSSHFDLRPFLYAGVSIVRNPLENAYVGFGFEPFNGIGLMGGLHIGQTSALVNNNGSLSVNDDVWKGGPFASVAIDLSIFNTLFTFDSIKNPFKN